MDRAKLNVVFERLLVNGRSWSGSLSGDMLLLEHDEISSFRKGQMNEDMYLCRR